MRVSAAFHVAIPNGGALSGRMPGAAVVYTMLRDSNARRPLRPECCRLGSIS